MIYTTGYASCIEISDNFDFTSDTNKGSTFLSCDMPIVKINQLKLHLNTFTLLNW